jgi:PAS domain S-box-containing protein
MRGKPMDYEHQDTSMMSAEYFRAIIDCVGDPVFVKNRQHRFVFVNDTACRMFGASFEQLLGKTDYDFFPKEQADVFRAHDERVFETGEEDINEEQITGGGRETRTIVTKKSCFVNKQGEQFIVGLIQDVTDRKHAEDALRATTLQLSEAMDMAKIVYWEHDESTEEFIFNDAFYAMYGTTAHQEGGYRMARDEYPKRFVHPDDLQRLTREIEINRAHPRMDDLEEYEHRAIRRDGEVIYVLDRNRVIMDSEGHVVKAVGVNQDITERKKAEEELQEKERKRKEAEDFLRTSQMQLADAMNLAKIAYWEIDIETGEFVFNDPFYALYGTTADREGGYRMGIEEYAKRFIHPDDQEAYFANHQKNMALLNLQSFFDFEHRALRQDGKVIHIFVRARVVRDESESIVRVYGSNQDITGPKEMEKALRSSEEKYRGLIENTLIGVFVVQDGAFRFVNEGFCQIHGYSREEIIGRMHPEDLIHPDYRDNLKVMKEELYSHEGQIERVQVVIRKDGSVRHVRILGHNIEYEGHHAYSGIAIDITNERTLETQLHQAQKMEAIGLLAGGIAHDFNNILTAIIGYGSLLLDKFHEKDPARADVETILASADRATQLTAGLLAFSRKQIIQPTTLDLTNVVTKVEQLLTRLLSEDIELKITYGPGPIPVFGDRGQLEQTLINLATNARDAMTGGGILTIDTRKSELTPDSPAVQKGLAPGHYGLITVSDTGCGMGVENLEKIFDPFYTTKEVGKGTGLGLAIVHGIIKQHKGDVFVTSQRGVGTCFTIYLPLTISSIKDEQPVTTLTPRGGKETIMVVEDDIVSRTLICEVLKRYGYSVLQAMDGEEAVEKYTFYKGRIDLVLLDVVMPKKNGKETFEEMKLLNPKVKALFVSGYTADIMEEKGFFENKDINFLSKPIMPQTFAAKVRQILDGV